MTKEAYISILTTIMNIMPFALVNETYIGGKGYFTFWDSNYVPKILEKGKFFNAALVEKVNAALEKDLERVDIV